MSQPEAALNKAYSLAKSAQTAVANRDYGKAIEKHKEAAQQLLQAKKLSTNASVQRALDTMYSHHLGESAKLEGLEHSRLSRIARIDEEEEEKEVLRADMDFAQIVDRFVNLAVSMNNQTEFEFEGPEEDTLSRLKIHVKALERNAQMRSTSLQTLGSKLRAELAEHNETTTRELRAENAQLRAENEKLNAQMTKMKSKWDSLVQNALNKRKERG
ncbi:hypothetical protein CJU89_4659 [Yarrowia sp. B02]|nr:hypothetical protein CJU89_4659 [Yarrowia sp. B02]